MHIEGEITNGIFLREIKNRFRCAVEVNGEEKICYVASSSRLSNFVDLVGKEVLLIPSGKMANVTDYTLLAVKRRNSHTILLLSLANEVLSEQLQRRMFSFLGSRKRVLREKTVAGYKADLYIEDTGTLIEVKTILSDQKCAVFPAVFSERTIKQLRHIKKLLNDGYRCCLVFAVLSPSVKKVIIDRNCEIHDLLLECIGEGLICKACRLQLKDKDIIVNKFIPIEMESL